MSQQIDHVVIGNAPQMPPGPLVEVESSRRRTPAEEARTLVHSHSVCSLATLTEDGAPWASMVTYGVMDDGNPVFYVSTLAEHGRALHRDGRASIVVVDLDRPRAGVDPLDTGRVTLQGTAHIPQSDTELEAARAAHFAAMPMAKLYQGFGDFDFWVLEVDQVRWVGGYGRMDSADATSYAEAEPDPVAHGAAHAIEHMNADHADALLIMARTIGGHPDATAARAVRIDRYGMDLEADTPRGEWASAARIPFAETLGAPEDLRAATVAAARRARELAATEPSSHGATGAV